MAKVAIIGAGMAGLSAAHFLLERNHRVHIITRDLPFNTTSAKAGAIWFPFAASPRAKVLRWSRFSYKYYQKHFLRNKNSGVHMVEMRVLDTPAQAQSWISALPGNAVRVLHTSELPQGYKHGYGATVPLIDTSVFIPYLWEKIVQKATFEQRTVHDIDSVLPDYNLTINCSGLGAKSLVYDPEVFPIRGQIVKIAPVPGALPTADDHGPNSLAYIIPRSDGVILGGTAQANRQNLEPDREEAIQIIERCQRLQNLGRVEVVDHIVGLRPGRAEVRVEPDPDLPGLCHNYGHGGSGFTICWGCAKDIVELLD